MNKHLTFHKGKYIRHLEPLELKPIDQEETHQTDSITLKKMVSKTVTSNTFNPPLHELSTTIQNSLTSLLEEYDLQFAQDETSIGTTTLTSMSIDTGTADPVSQKPYPIAMKHQDWVKTEIEKLLAAKVICSSHSSWSAPIIVVPKGDGGKCLVIDYRALNKVTRKFTWPMPKVEDIFSKLNGATYFTTLDLRAGYHYIPLDKSSIPKTALGHILSATGICPLPSKTQAICNMNAPTTPKQVRAFLGLVGYYRKFIKGFAKITKPLTLLTRQQVNFEWTQDHQTAFEHLKNAIVQAPIYIIQTPIKPTLYILMLWMMLAEHKSLKNMMEQNFP